MNKWRNNPHRYGLISQLLHWLMGFCIIFMISLGLLLDIIPGMWKPSAISLHKSVGIVILALVIVRLCWRVLNRPPKLPETIRKMQAAASHSTHWLLYSLMLAMPITGWIMSSAFGKPVALFGIFTLPNLVEKDRNLGVYFKELHESVGYVLIAVITLHICAALYHHFIRKDDILKRMLPERLVK